MNIRIISGALGGRFIRPPKGAARGFRPTLERVRQSVADSIAGRIPGAVVADLCAGCGAFGLEMISRGAKQVDFVEADAGRVACIRDHIAAFGVVYAARCHKSDVCHFIRRRSESRYDIIFYDPPYGNQELIDYIPAILPLLSGNGILIYQRDRASGGECVGEDRKFAPRGYIRDSRRYGRTVVDFYRRLPMIVKE